MPDEPVTLRCISCGLMLSVYVQPYSAAPTESPGNQLQQVILLSRVSSRTALCVPGHTACPRTLV